MVAVLVITAAAADAAGGIRREAVRAWTDITSTSRTAHADARVIVVLRAQPAATRTGAIGSADAATAAKTAQDRVLAALASHGIRLTVEQRFTLTVNAVVAKVRGDQRARLARDHGVLGVYPVRQLVPATVSESVATALGDAVRPVAAALPGAGAGVTIAVLDGPIDDTHPALAGRIDRPAGAAPGSSDATAEHGTAIASLAAGGAGPAGLHGVASAARVLAIRVLAPASDGALAGTTVDLLAGLERVADPDGNGDLADHARVAVAAVAAPFAGFDDAPEARAITALGRLGTVVVAPVGNDGPTGGRFGSVASPGGAADALTVGASDGRPALPQVAVEIGGALPARVTAALAGALAPAQGQTLVVTAISGAARTGPTAGALASDYQDPTGRSLVAGTAVLVPRDGGDLRAKARQAAAQGAAALLVYGGAELPAGALGGDDRVGIPVLGIDQALGQQLAQAVAAGQSVTIKAGASTYTANAARDAVAGFSSEGLGWDDGLKPDLVLPGVAIIGAASGGGYAAVSGTSVAAAQAAGLLAVLAAQHSDWSAARLRSALVSTGVLVRGLDAPLAPVQAQGGGRPDVATAAAVTVATSPVSLSLGRPGADGVAHGELTIENLTDATRTLTLGLQHDAAGDATGLTAAIDPARFALAPHAVAKLPVSVRLQTPSAAAGVAGGWLVITPDAGPAQHVPVAVALSGPAEPPVRTATLTPGTVAAADGTAKLTLALGAAGAPGDGSVQLGAVRTLSLELYRGDRRLAVLYTARDLLPGRYTFTVRPVGAGGKALVAGRYRIVVRATGTDGDESRTSLRLRVR